MIDLTALAIQTSHERKLVKSISDFTAKIIRRNREASKEVINGAKQAAKDLYVEKGVNIDVYA